MARERDITPVGEKCVTGVRAGQSGTIACLERLQRIHRPLPRSPGQQQAYGFSGLLPSRGWLTGSFRFSVASTENSM